MATIYSNIKKSYTVRSTIPHARPTKISANDIDTIDIASLKHIYGTVTDNKTTGQITFNMLEYTTIEANRKWYQFEKVYNMHRYINPGQISTGSIADIIKQVEDPNVDETRQLLIIIHTLNQLKKHIQNVLNSTAQNILSNSHTPLVEYANLVQYEMSQENIYDRNNISIYPMTLFDFLKGTHPLMNQYLNNPKLNKNTIEEIQKDYNDALILNTTDSIKAEAKYKNLNLKIKKLLEE